MVLLRSEIPSGMCAKLHTVAASNNRVHMPWSLYYCLFAPHICMVLFFTHIPFVVNHTINATPPERLQQCVMFTPQTVSRSAKPPGSLVSGPHCNYKKAKEHYNNHHNYHKLCAAMFDSFVQTDADKSKLRKIEIVFPIPSERLNFAVSKKYHWGVTETLVHFHWTKLTAMTEFLKLP